MPITLYPPEWREERLAEHRAELAAMFEAAPKREHKNGELAMSLGDRLDVLTFRGVTYDVPTLNYTDGFELNTLWAQLTDLSRAADRRERENRAGIEAGEMPSPVYTEAQFTEILTLLRRAVVLFWQNVRVQEPPRGMLARAWHRVVLAWRAAKNPDWRANPFETASQADVAELFSFFFACRTRSDVRRHPGGRMTAPRDPSITPKT